MKLAIDLNLALDAQTLQKIYQVTVISDKGLVFMHRDDWYKICDMIEKCSQVLWNNKTDNKLAENFSLWNECFIIAYDESEDFSCHAICNFDLFSLCCRRCNINCVLLPVCDLISYVSSCNAYNNNEVLGWYTPSNGDVLIEVADN